MNLDYNKLGGLVPAIIQDNKTGKVLMLGFMNEEAFRKTQETGKVTFFSRTKNRLWTKGEESGNFLHVVSIKGDCDNDTLLIKVNPVGPVCHTGADTCWDEENKPGIGSLIFLQDYLATQHETGDSDLFRGGENRLTQMLGESAVTTILEAINGADEKFLNEASGLLYNMMALLALKGYRIEDLVKKTVENSKLTAEK